MSILGAGGIAYGAAAYLSRKGHDPLLWSPSGKRTAELAAGKPIVATNGIEGSFKVRVASSCKEAVEQGDVVMIALPGFAHKTVIEAIAPHLRADQFVIISSHASFGALYLSKLLAARKISVPIVVWGTTVTTGFLESWTRVNVGSVRQKVDMATVPQSRNDEAYDLCNALFDDRFVKRAGLLAIAMSNVNPQNHLGIALLNLTRIERGEEWAQGENVTGTVGRLIEALDEERLAIAAKLGVSVRTVKEHFALSFHVPIATVAEMNQETHRQGRSGLGPKNINSRYILEDVPFGLYPTCLLGQLVGAPARLHEAGIDIFSASYGRDFRKDNDLIPALGLEKISLEELRKVSEHGFEF